MYDPTLIERETAMITEMQLKLFKTNPCDFDELAEYLCHWLDSIRGEQSFSDHTMTGAAELMVNYGTYRFCFGYCVEDERAAVIEFATFEEANEANSLFIREHDIKVDCRSSWSQVENN